MRADPMKKLLAVTVLLAMIGSVPAATEDPTRKAVELIGEARHADAARLLEPLAKAGNADAQYHLGLLHYAGKGVAENERRAVELLKSSAAQGNVNAMYQLGNAFTFGNETPRLVADADVEAAQWYYKAAKLGHADAQYSLGLLFMAGKGVEKDQKEATYWMQEAAKHGHKDAKSYVAGRK
jgi:TPR repeat protein